MCFASSPALAAPPAPPPPPEAANLVDPAVQKAREDARKRAAGLAGYGSTIATSGLGLTVPAPNTTGLKQQLGA